MKSFFLFCFILTLCYEATEAQTNAGIPDASTVLVVYNANSDTSIMIKNYYVQSRNISAINVVPGLQLPRREISVGDWSDPHIVKLGYDNEYIQDSTWAVWDSTHCVDTAKFHAWQYFIEEVANPIRLHLQQNNLTSTIRYIVMCRGVPYKIQAAGDYSIPGNISVDGLLAMLNTPNYDDFVEAIFNNYTTQCYAGCDSTLPPCFSSPTVLNPYYNQDPNYEMNSRFVSDYYTKSWNGYDYKLSYLVSRLDGLNFDIIKDIIDKSVDADTTGEKTWILDGGGPGILNIAAANNNLTTLGFNTEYNSDITNWITSSPNKVIGYTSAGVHQGGMPITYIQDTLDFNYAKGAVFNTYESFNGYSIGTIRRAGDQGLMTEFTLMDGTGGTGNTWEPHEYRVVNSGIYFPSYAIGYNQIDAAWLGMPYLAWRNVIVGDPLTKIFNYNVDTLVGNVVWSGITTMDKRRVVIPAGSSLTISSGSELVLETNASLIVKGSLFIQPGATITLNSYSRIVANDMTLNPNSKLILNDLSSTVIYSSGRLMTFTDSEIRLNGQASLKVDGNALIGNGSVFNVSDNSYISATSRFIVSEGSVFTFLGNGTISFDSILNITGTSLNKVTFNSPQNAFTSVRINCDSVSITHTEFIGLGITCELNAGLSNGLISIKNNLFSHSRTGISLEGKFETEYQIRINKNIFNNFSHYGIRLGNVPSAVLDSNLLTVTGLLSSETGIFLIDCGVIDVTNNDFNINCTSGIRVLTGRAEEFNTVYYGRINLFNLNINGNSGSSYGILVEDNNNRIEVLNLSNSTISNFKNGFTVKNSNNFSPWIAFNSINEYQNKAISIINGNEAIIRNNVITHSGNSSIEEQPTGIYLSQVNNSVVIDNIISCTNNIIQGPGIFSLSSNGQIRRNIISGHLHGIELSGSSSNIALNIITGNKEYGIYAGSTSVPNLGSTSFDEEGYPLTGYNNIYENGGCSFVPLSEIYLSGSYIELSKGCNTVADNRYDALHCDNTFLMDGDHVGDIIYAEYNYWGNHPLYGHNPSGRFGEHLQVQYEEYLLEPCSETPGELYLIIRTADGTVVDTVFSSGSIQFELSELAQAYSLADKNFYTGNYSNAMQGYFDITNNFGTSKQSLKAYSRLYQIYRLSNVTKQEFIDLRNYYDSKISGISDSTMTLILNHLADLCLIAEKEYLAAIGNFENIANNNPNTDLAFYSELNALTTSLLASSDSTMGKISGKYAVNGIDDYYERINKLSQQRSNSSKQEDIQLPKEFNLYQNYPNPFNPNTTIKFDIPEQTEVELTIFDILGRRVKTLVNNEVKQPGYYEVTFSAQGVSASGGNASDLASGIYFYQLRTNKFTSTRKMMMVK